MFYSKHRLNDRLESLNNPEMHAYFLRNMQSLDSPNYIKNIQNRKQNLPVS